MTWNIYGGFLFVYVKNYEIIGDFLYSTPNDRIKILKTPKVMKNTFDFIITYFIIQ